MRTLAQWLDYQLQLHDQEIDLGLERVRPVWEAMGHLSLPPIITVGGTNGKGSTLTFLDCALRASGYKTGLYTSPHLLQYNERICLNGEMASDTLLCQAFAAVEQARDNIPITYFEFGTLAAMHLFARAELDILLLEVGLGGRLDAVNLFDPAVSVVTNVTLDHMDWLGPDVETIGREKAGIFRPNRPAIIGMQHPPSSLIQTAEQLGAPLVQLGRDFWVENEGGRNAGWDWCSPNHCERSLPWPAMPGRFQLDNAATAWMALRTLNALPLFHEKAISRSSLELSLQKAQLSGRLQIFPGPVERWFDVSHNEAAASVIAEHLRQHPPRGRNIAVFGLLRDKDAEAVIQALKPMIDVWILGGLAGSRGRSGEELLTTLQQLGISGKACATIADAWQEAERLAQSGDRILAFGSFHVVEEALRAANIL